MSTAEIADRPLDRSEAGLKRLIANPAEYFGYSAAAMHDIPRKTLEALQLSGLKLRFQQLRDNVPTLKKLADEQKVGAVDNLDDVVPLLFSHTVYKSYPLSFLEKSQFTPLTKWLNKLTTVDLSGLDVSHCQSIDEWLGTLDEKTPIRIRHSSGTSGAMSFIPRTLAENDKHFFSMVIGQFEARGLKPPRREAPLSMHLVQPTFRTGYTAFLRSNDYFCKYIAGGDESRIHMLYPGRQSSDLMFLAGRLRAAMAKGELDRLELTPTLRARKAEFEALQKNQPEDIKAFYTDIREKLAGEKVYVFGAWSMLYNVASAGLEKGYENVFSPDSMLVTGGGAKGQTVPPDWEDQVKRFFGVPKLLHGYGMSEIMGIHKLCDHNRFHLEPWTILFILDPDTGAPMPRKGVQTGRAAFYDLLAETYWGGFVSGDEITVDWDTPCACGRKSAHIDRKIERYSEQRGGDDKISCAAAADAHDAALAYLTDAFN